MSEETKKILEMVASGQISAADAEKLLEKLGNRAESKSAGPRPESPVPPATLKFLRVLVDSPGSEKVNVRVPLAFLRAGMKLLAIVPPVVNSQLKEKGIDLNVLSELKGEPLEQALRDLHVDVDQSNGQKVQVFCE